MTLFVQFLYAYCTLSVFSTASTPSPRTRVLLTLMALRLAVTLALRVMGEGSGAGHDGEMDGSDAREIPSTYHVNSLISLCHSCGLSALARVSQPGSRLPTT